MRIQLARSAVGARNSANSARRGESDRGDAGGRRSPNRWRPLPLKETTFWFHRSGGGRDPRGKQKDEPTNGGGIIWDGHGSINRVQARVLDISMSRMQGKVPLQQSTGSAAPTVPGLRATSSRGAAEHARGAADGHLDTSTAAAASTTTTSTYGPPACRRRHRRRRRRRRRRLHRRRRPRDRCSWEACSSTARPLRPRGAAPPPPPPPPPAEPQPKRPRASTSTGLMSAADFAESLGANRTVTVRVSVLSTTNAAWSLLGQEVSVEVDCDCTIKEVKSRLKAQLGMPENKQQLKHSRLVSQRLYRARTSTCRRARCWIWWSGRAGGARVGVSAGSG